jgi:hypothetical protein
MRAGRACEARSVLKQCAIHSAGSSDSTTQVGGSIPETSCNSARNANCYALRMLFRYRRFIACQAIASASLLWIGCEDQANSTSTDDNAAGSSSMAAGGGGSTGVSSGGGPNDNNYIQIDGSMTAGPPCSNPDGYIQIGRDVVTSNTWNWTPYAYPHPLQAMP